MSNEWMIVMSKRERALQKRIQEKKRACKVAQEKIAKALLAISDLKTPANAANKSEKKIKKKVRGGRRIRERRERRVEAERRETVAMHNLVKNAFENAMAFDTSSLAPPSSFFLSS